MACSVNRPDVRYSDSPDSSLDSRQKLSSAGLLLAGERPIVEVTSTPHKIDLQVIMSATDHLICLIASVLSDRCIEY